MRRACGRTCGRVGYDILHNEQTSLASCRRWLGYAILPACLRGRPGWINWHYSGLPASRLRCIAPAGRQSSLAGRNKRAKFGCSLGVFYRPVCCLGVVWRYIHSVRCGNTSRDLCSVARAYIRALTVGNPVCTYTRFLLCIPCCLRIQRPYLIRVTECQNLPEMH